MRRMTLAVLLLATWPVLVDPAQGHVQVSPTLAAPGDAVKFLFLVPNEREESTVEVALQVPKDVLPFSFDDPPGWRRTLEKRGDGSIEVVRWRGRLQSDGFAEFAFLASTPEKVGPIAWKSIQTYADGKETAWIGPPDSDEPAAVTQVTADAPLQNAGGESEGGEAAPAEAAATSTTSGDDDNRDPLAIVLGAGGLVLGAIALFVALRSRRGRDAPNAGPS